MIKVFLAFFLVFSLSACKKQEAPEQIKDEIRIEIVSGNNQWDTLGHILQDSVVVRVTKNNIPLSLKLITVQKSNCTFLPESFLLTNSNGLASYMWQLTGKQGDQTIKFIVKDTANIIQDSVVAHAEGRYFINAWQLADCLPYAGINDICQASSGRLFCGLLNFDYPYYSDNNGQTWQKLTSFPVSNKEIRQMVAQGNEIFIATRHDGIYFSPDNGLTWENRSNGISDKREVQKLGLTKSGKLFLSTIFKPLFISTDKGISWTEITNGVDFNDRMSQFSETSTGVLFMISDDEELYRSVSGGISWTKVRSFPFHNVQSFYVDDNDDFYSGNFGSVANIYKSTDGGTNWTLKYSSPQVPGTSLEVKDFYKINGFYYFMIAGYGIIKTSNFSSYQSLTNMYNLDYFVSNTNIVFVPGMFEWLWYSVNP